MAAKKDTTEKTPVYRIVLPSKKVVLLREVLIKHQELAIKAVGTRAGENSALLQSMTTKELLKMLIVSIDGKAPAQKDLEDLDGLFTFKEYVSLNSAMGKIMGASDGDLGNFEIEIELGGNT